MPKRKVYGPKPPKKQKSRKHQGPPKKPGPRKIYGDEPTIAVGVSLTQTLWARILELSPPELHHKNSAVLRWFIENSIGKY